MESFLVFAGVFIMVGWLVKLVFLIVSLPFRLLWAVVQFVAWLVKKALATDEPLDVEEWDGEE